MEASLGRSLDSNVDDSVSPQWNSVSSAPSAVPNTSRSATKRGINPKIGTSTQYGFFKARRKHALGRTFYRGPRPTDGVVQ